jgi:MYXO-CTERM domain-containing protein
MFLPQVSQFDYETPSFTGEQGELVIDASSDPPFDAGSTYAFVVVHQNCPITQGVLTTDAEASTMGTGGAGGEGGGGAMGGNGSTGDVVVDDGCACRIVGERRRAPSAAWLALALALGVGLRRRRAQRTRRR